MDRSSEQLLRLRIWQAGACPGKRNQSSDDDRRRGGEGSAATLREEEPRTEWSVRARTVQGPAPMGSFVGRVYTVLVAPETAPVFAGAQSTKSLVPKLVPDSSQLSRTPWT